MRYDARPVPAQALSRAAGLPQGALSMTPRMMPSQQPRQPSDARMGMPMGALSVPPAFKMPPASQSAFTHANPHARFLSTLPGAPQLTNPVPPAMNNPLMGTPTEMRGRVREMALGGGPSELLQRILAARGMQAGKVYPGT